MRHQLVTVALLFVSLSATAEVDFACQADCTGRYSTEYCDQACSYKSQSPGYKPSGALGAYIQGQQDADRDAKNHLQIQQQKLQLYEQLKVKIIQECMASGLTAGTAEFQSCREAKSIEYSKMFF
jgi:hypothetical protein